MVTKRPKRLPPIRLRGGLCRYSTPATTSGESISAGLLRERGSKAKARLAEPHPGFAFDGFVEGVGAIATLVLVALLGAIPALRAATARWTALGTADLASTRRPSLLARLVRSFPPSGRAGVRMALHPGAGRTAVPVRTATFGAAISLVA